MAERLIPLAVMEQILKKAGELRVGEDAKAAMKEALENYALELAKKAQSLAEHAGRRTIKSEDIKLAVKNN